MNNLKPCPSCGREEDGAVHGPIKLQEFAVNGRLSVMCYGCGLTGPLGQDKAHAYDLWNALPRHVEPQPIETFKDEWRGTHENAPRFLFRHKATGWCEGYMLLGVPEFPVSLVCTDYLQRIDDVTHWLPMPPLPEVK